MVLEPQVLVAARLYPSQDAVIENALRSLLQEKPQLRLELAIYRYQTEDISLAKAANLAGISFDRMKAVLLQRGVQLRLGPVDDAEIQEKVATLERLFDDSRARKAARSMGVPISGTLGLLIEAVKANLLSVLEADNLLHEMILLGYRSPHGTVSELMMEGKNDNDHKKHSLSLV